MFFFNNVSFSQTKSLDTLKVKSDFNKIMMDLQNEYVYFNQKEVDVNCLNSYYSNQIKFLENNTDVLLFFEYLLNEFYDNHLHLQSNTNSSFRLNSPIYALTREDKTIISSYFKDQIENEIALDLINAEILTFNGIAFNKVIDNFPTHCQNKKNNEVRTWISNKILSGRYNEPRIITLKTASGKIESFDLDKIILKKETTLVSHFLQNNVGIIRINNSLGNSQAVKEFKRVIEKLKNTDGIILDLRNTVDGGNTNIAYPIAGHFTNKKRIFQKYKNANTKFVDYIKPQKPYYKKPLVLVVGRWTGSVGEGLASGFEGTGIAKVIGTEMQKLAGATKNFNFIYCNFGYQMPYIEVLQQNNEPRENFIPKYKVEVNNNKSDEFITEAMRIINEIK